MLAIFPTDSYNFPAHHVGGNDASWREVCPALICAFGKENNSAPVGNVVEDGSSTLPWVKAFCRRGATREISQGQSPWYRD
jgi:hypothetical protein